MAARFGAQANASGTLTASTRAHAADLELQTAGWSLLGVGVAALVADAVVVTLTLRRR